MRRLLIVAMAFAGAAACSYIIELPATNPIPIDTDASADASDEASPPTSSGYVPYNPPPGEPFCANQAPPPVYCNDFDGEPAPDLASLGTVQATGGQLVLSSAVFHSPPRSLLATVRGTSSVASLTRALDASPDGLTLSFDLLVSVWDTSDARLAQVELVDGTNRCVVRIDGTATNWAVAQVCSTDGTETANTVTSSASPIQASRWQRFRLAIAYAPAKTITLDIDGARAVEVPGVPQLQRATATIGLGATLVPTGNVTLFQDNVLVTSP